jgi:hypothetical protein
MLRPMGVLDSSDQPTGPPVGSPVVFFSFGRLAAIQRVERTSLPTGIPLYSQSARWYSFVSATLPTGIFIVGSHSTTE